MWWPREPSIGRCVLGFVIAPMLKKSFPVRLKLSLVRVFVFSRFSSTQGGGPDLNVNNLAKLSVPCLRAIMWKKLGESTLQMWEPRNSGSGVDPEPKPLSLGSVVCVMLCLSRGKGWGSTFVGSMWFEYRFVTLCLSPTVQSMSRIVVL